MIKLTNRDYFSLYVLYLLQSQIIIFANWKNEETEFFFT